MSVIAHHLIWTTYGTWLGNDPRGSGSRNVYTPVLAELGDLHYGRKRIQPARSKVREFYENAERLLKYDVIRFNEGQVAEIAKGFANTVVAHQYTCYACAIMPDHSHLVIRKHREHAEDMIDYFQQESREWLIAQGVVPEWHPLWTKGGWKVFLNTPEEVWSRVRYVERNPEKENLPKQSWPFVTAYNNWPFHNKLNRKR